MSAARQRILRIELVDVTGSIQDETYRSSTIANVEIEVPASTEIPGERIIEGARLAYLHLMGSSDDLRQLLEDLHSEDR